MSRQMSIAYRPKSFGQMVGQKKLLESISNHLSSDEEVTAWMFIGETGSGKTTLARIMALSYQCEHKKFGYPCKKCRLNRYKYDIVPIPASKIRDVETLEKLISGAHDYPKHGSKKRVYILDELQEASAKAQSMLYGYFEDAPASTIWIICTTDPDRIKKALRGRCQTYRLKPLDEVGIRELVLATLNRAGKSQEISAMRLATALWEAGVTSARLVVQAVSKRIAGSSDEEAALVESEFDTSTVVKAVVTGDWETTRSELIKATASDARIVRNNIASYLRAMLLNSEEFDDRTQAIRDSVLELGNVNVLDDGMSLSQVVAICHKLCRKLRKYHNFEDSK